MKRDLKLIITEAKAIRDAHKGTAMPEAEAQKLEALLSEGQELQTELDRKSRLSALELVEAKGREVPEPALPASSQEDRSTSAYTTLGQLFVASEQFKSYIRAGKPQGWSAPLQAKTMELYQALSASERKAFDAANIGDFAALIQPQHLAEIINRSENRQLTLRDVLTVAPTTSDSISYVVKEPVTGTARSVAPTALKPFIKHAFTKVTRPVVTIAALEKVTEQQLDDVGSIIATVDGDLRFAVRAEEERQIVWGSGEDEELLGLFNTPGVAALARSVEGDTILDKIIRAMTDVELEGLAPNAALLHPLDREALDLLKGSDGNYIRAVVAGQFGPRIASLSLVSSVAMQGADEERRLLVGDYTRGATLHDRKAVSVAVGFMDDDFGRNLRTLRGEERVGFSVRRPKAFRYLTTNAAVQA